MEMSFFVSTKLLRQVQLLVMRYNGYFERNPFEMGDRSQVNLSFENVHNANKFSVMLYISEMGYF